MVKLSNMYTASVSTLVTGAVVPTRTPLTSHSTLPSVLLNKQVRERGVPNTTAEEGTEESSVIVGATGRIQEQVRPCLV